MRINLLLSVLLLVVAGALFAAPPAASTSSAIGFRLIERQDVTRSSAQFSNGRPIQIAFWYPSAPASRELTYRDYYLLSARETAFSPSTAASDEIPLVAPLGLTYDDVLLLPGETDVIPSALAGTWSW